MKRIILAAALMLAGITTQAQMVATMEITEPIPGLCNPTTVYVLIPMFDGNKEAISPLSDNQIAKKVNAECQYLKDHPDFEAKGMMNLIINCKGIVIRCMMGNTTGTEEFDAEVAAIFNALGKWKPGKLNGKKVDSTLLYSIEVVDGKFIMK